MRLCVTVAWCPCFYTGQTVLFFVRLDMRPSKENTRRLTRGQLGSGSEAISACLCDCYHLLFPVKTGKDRGENGARKVLPWCELAGGPAPPDSDPPSQEKQTRSGRSPQWDSLCCYFYHFHNTQWGMLFPAVDTGLGHFRLQKQCSRSGEIWIGGASGHDHSLCLLKEILRDICLMTKVRH